jgi:hypothetical protein
MPIVVEAHPSSHWRGTYTLRDDQGKCFAA